MRALYICGCAYISISASIRVSVNLGCQYANLGYLPACLPARLPVCLSVCLPVRLHACPRLQAVQTSQVKWLVEIEGGSAHRPQPALGYRLFRCGDSVSAMVLPTKIFQGLISHRVPLFLDISPLKDLDQRPEVGQITCRSW